MVEMEKAQLIRQEWIIKHNNIIIPITAVKAFMEIILLFAVSVFAYNVGQNDAAEQIKLNAYISNNGIYNPTTNSFYKCYMDMVGNAIKWRCEDTNYTLSGGMKIPKSWLNDTIK